VPVLYTYLDAWSEHRRLRREARVTAAKTTAPAHGTAGK
jgi:hypothetical protein